MTTAQVVQTSVTVNNSPIQDYTHRNDHASPTCTYEMTPGFKPFTKLNPSAVVDFRFSASRHSCMHNEQLSHTGGSLSVFLTLIKSFQSNFIHSRILHSYSVLRSCSQKFTAHYVCSNADLNLILVLAMTDEFICHIIDSLWNLVEYI